MLKLTHQFRGPCIICNCMPVDETKPNRPPLPMFVAVGVDVNWGENLNVCKICAGVMADLMGRPDEVKVQRLKTKLTALQGEFEKLMGEHDSLKERVRRMIDGKKAMREQRGQ